MPPIPTNIKLHKKSKVLDLEYANAVHQLSCEYLRVYSPSAEVRGHGKGQEVLQTGKKEVGIENIEASGNYGLKLCFDDGHDTGIYTWNYLHELCINQESYWDDYLQRMHRAGASRVKHANVVQLMPGTKNTP
ncbi:MAG: DUF971 domain-containing protein [Pseudomonadales bacterium]|nr:DUF971 domain-containing protein [Pseudomonadales bacterium]